jgi:hypothetical protein
VGPARAGPTVTGPRPQARGLARPYADEDMGRFVADWFSRPTRRVADLDGRARIRPAAIDQPPFDDETQLVHALTDIYLALRRLRRTTRTEHCE